MNENTIWTADILTDPKRDHRLYIELLENEVERAAIYENDDGEVVISFYHRPQSCIPALWLMEIIQRYQVDLDNYHKDFPRTDC